MFPSFFPVCNTFPQTHTHCSNTVQPIFRSIPLTPPHMSKYLQFLEHHALFHFPARVILCLYSKHFRASSLHLPFLHQANSIWLRLNPGLKSPSPQPVLTCFLLSPKRPGDILIFISASSCYVMVIHLYAFLSH